MADTKVKFDLDTAKAVEKIKVLAAGLRELGEVCDRIADSLERIDVDGRDAWKTVK